MTYASGWAGQRGLTGFFLQLLLLIALFSPHARAEKISQADSTAIQATVQRQFDAFARDDAVAAFALASSSIRKQFGTADKFMTVVKMQYQPVYRHRTVIFSEAERLEGAVTQQVRLTDTNDRVWDATYRLEREADGQWRILGCELVETKSVSV